ncbi:MFS transporter [Tomitella cavernea]|uniref:MFS transporter n=1 Tax=Tomitella cavernea TaxID=1387982 RepID=UPI003CD0A59E
MGGAGDDAAVAPGRRAGGQATWVRAGDGGVRRGRAGPDDGRIAAAAAGVYALVAVVGVGYAGTQMFPLAMLPDTLADDARATGASRAGILTGVWTAGETVGLALGPFVVVSVVLGLSGYVSGSGDETMAQPSSALHAITWSMSLVPAACALLSIVFVLAHRPPDHGRTGHAGGGEQIGRGG